MDVHFIYIYTYAYEHVCICTQGSTAWTEKGINYWYTKQRGWISDIMLSKRNQKQRSTNCMTSFILNSRTGRAYLWWKGSEKWFPLWGRRVGVNWKEVGENFWGVGNLHLDRGVYYTVVCFCQNSSNGLDLNIFLY